MNKIILLLITAILLVGCHFNDDLPIQETVVDTTMRQFDCQSSGDICTDLEYTLPVELVNFPNCLFLVEFDYEICKEDLSNVILNVYDFDLTAVGSATDPSIDCSDYHNAEQNAINNGIEDQFYINNNREIWTRITDYLLGQYGILGNLTTINYAISSCTKICLVRLETKGNLYSVIQVKESCGTECCRRTTTYQPGLDGQWVPIANQWDTPLNPCTINDVECTYMAMSGSNCFGRCDELVGF